MGSLKCCLNYELDTYLDALKAFPRTEEKLYTKKGTAVCQKIDIFQGFLWYAYEGDWMNWHKLTPEQANVIIKANKDKEPVASLEEYEVVATVEANANSDYDVVGQDSLTRFDKPKTATKKRRKNNKRRKGKPSNNNNA